MSKYIAFKSFKGDGWSVRRSGALRSYRANLSRRISKNLIFDGILYDCLMLLFYAMGFIICGLGKEFTLVNYCGIGVVILGLVFLKM